MIITQFTLVLIAYSIFVISNIIEVTVYDEKYIDHLIDEISQGRYDPDLLNDAEREQIALKLKDIK